MPLKKENINYIIALMCVAVAGLILLQFYWISNTLHVQEEYFNQSVARAMNEVVNKIEKRQAADLMAARIKTMLNQGHPGLHKRVKIFKRGNKIQGTLVIEDSSSSENGDVKMHSYRKMYLGNEGKFPFTLPNGPKPLLMDYGDIVRLDSEITGLSDETVIKSFFDSVMPGGIKAGVIKDLFREIALGGNMVKDISQQEYATLINSALLNQGIDIYYVFGVLNPSESRIEKVSSQNYINELLGTPYKISLIENSIFAQPYYLSIYFPGKNKFLFRQMSFVLTSSAFLIFLIVFCFAFTVHIINKQKKLSQMKTDFINNMTHEFKTPVSTILLASEALKDPSVKGNDERINRLVNMIHEENNRIGSHVERVLQLAAMEKGNFKLNMGPIDIHALIKRVIEGISIQAENKNGKIEADLKATNIDLDGDALHLSNVIYNLLDNSIKYCTTAPLIRVITRDYRDGVLISVVDNGIGLTKDQQNKVFEQFYRVPTGNLHDVKGFGLGLHYVKSIIEVHGGSINIQSEKGKGSTFEVYLPLINKNHEQD